MQRKYSSLSLLSICLSTEVFHCPRAPVNLTQEKLTSEEQVPSKGSLLLCLIMSRNSALVLHDSSNQYGSGTPNFLTSLAYVSHLWSLCLFQFLQISSLSPNGTNLFPKRSLNQVHTHIICLAGKLPHRQHSVQFTKTCIHLSFLSTKSDHGSLKISSDFSDGQQLP